MGRTLQRPALLDRRKGKLQEARLHLRCPMSAMQGPRPQQCASLRGGRRRPKAGPRPGRSALPGHLPRPIRVLGLHERTRPCQRLEKESEDKCYVATQPAVPQSAGDLLLHDGDLHPLRPDHQAVQGGGLHHRWRPGHSAQLQARVPARSCPFHHDAERLRKIVWQTQMLLSNILFFSVVKLLYFSDINFFNTWLMRALRRRQYFQK